MYTRVTPLPGLGTAETWNPALSQDFQLSSFSPPRRKSPQTPDAPDAIPSCPTPLGENHWVQINTYGELRASEWLQLAGGCLWGQVPHSSPSSQLQLSTGGFRKRLGTAGVGQEET
jgi:hypothetical protein